MRLGKRIIINKWIYSKTFNLDFGVGLSNWGYSPTGWWLNFYFGLGYLGILVWRKDDSDNSSKER